MVRRRAVRERRAEFPDISIRDARPPTGGLSVNLRLSQLSQLGGLFRIDMETRELVRDV